MGNIISHSQNTEFTAEIHEITPQKYWLGTPPWVRQTLHNDFFAGIISVVFLDLQKIE